jgi:alpha-1,6-mannosyltransferase
VPGCEGSERGELRRLGDRICRQIACGRVLSQCVVDRRASDAGVQRDYGSTCGGGAFSTVKVLDVTEFYSVRGGGVRSHLTLKSHVSCQLGHEHWVVAPGPPNAADSDNNGMAPHEPTARATVLHVGGPPLPYDPTYHLLWRVDKVRDAVLQRRPDVLEIHSPYVAAASAMSLGRASFGIRTFVWHADFIDTYLRGSLERKLGPRATNVVVEPLWAWVRAIARACDATFVASKWQKDKLDAHAVERTVLLPFGVEKDVFTPTAKSEAVKRELLGGQARAGGKDPALLVAIGRFAVEKRWDVVLDAFIELRARGRDAVLVIFGDGPERARMQAQVSGRDDVRFLGFERDRERLAQVLASADALVHGCPFETFGLGVAEAVACGLPLVVPDQGGAFEQADPVSSIVYPTGDSHACARAIEELLDRDPAARTEAALAAAARVPSVQSHFEKLYAAYDQLLQARGPARVKAGRASARVKAGRAS